MRFLTHIVFTLLLALAGVSAFANPAAPAPGDPPIRKLDGHLVDLKGRGLYTWDGDVKGNTSQCTAQCRLLWPPLFAEANAVPKGPFTLVRRDDGRYQWALKGRPLYRWASDRKWGDAGGDGVADVWHLVKVAAPKKAGAQ
jgi:predicted lipoprotein with Yx(FWY)xxD motif